MDWRMMSNTATVTTLPTPAPAPAPAPSRAKKAAATRTKLDRTKRAIELEAIERERKENANKMQRFSAQHKFVLVLLLTLAGLMAAASFITSFTGLFGATAWAVGDAVPWLQAAAPCMYDVAIIAFTVKLFMDKEEGEKVIFDWFWIGLLATVSATANVFHTLTVTTAANPQQLIMGCVISGSAPFLLALVTDVAASKVFKKAKAVVASA